MKPAKLALVAGAAAIAAAAIVGGAVYYAQQRRIDDLESRLSDLYEQRSSAETTKTPAVAPDPAPAATAEDEPTSETSASERQYSFVTDVAEGTSPAIVADYAQFLTGDDAVAAAAAAGDESPPPNDYYVVNENPRLRTLKVRPGISVRLTSNPDGTVDPAGYTVSLDVWAGYYAAPSDENAGIRGGGYWLSLEDGVVVAIEQQYVP